MISRLIVCGALACCFFAGGAVASADRADAKLFKGKTSQGYRIKAQVRDQAFRIHVFDIDLRCRDGSELALIMGGYLWTKVGKLLPRPSQRAAPAGTAARHRPAPRRDPLRLALDHLQREPPLRNLSEKPSVSGYPAAGQAVTVRHDGSTPASLPGETFERTLFLSRVPKRRVVEVSLLTLSRKTRTG